MNLKNGTCQPIFSNTVIIVINIIRTTEIHVPEYIIRTTEIQVLEYILVMTFLAGHKSNEYEFFQTSKKS